MSGGLLTESLRLGLAGGISALGAGVMLLAALAYLRLPDVYTRLHALSLMEGYGLWLTLGGLALASGDWRIAGALGALGVVVRVCGPALRQAIAGTAHAGGLDPLVGAQRSAKPPIEGGR